MKKTQIVLHIDSVDYDTTNPRIAHIFEEGKPPTPEEISRALRDESSDTLRRSIKQAGGISNPIKVIQGPGDSFKVFEGNTRLSIYKHFDSKGEEGDWEHIPAEIYEGLDDRKIDVIRVQDHLVGTQPWSAYAKSKYLYQLSKDFTPGEIAGLCGESQNEILRSIETHQFMNRYYKEIVDTEELSGPAVDPFFNERQYTAFEEYIKLEKAKDAVDRAGYTDEDFSRWVARGLFTRNEDVRVLPEILERENTRNIFLKLGTREAKKYLDTPGLNKQLKEASLVTLCKAVLAKLNNIPRPEISDFKNNRATRTFVRDSANELRAFHDEYNESE